MCIFLHLRIRSRRKRNCKKKKNKCNEDEWDSLTAQNKLQCRRQAMCEINAVDREVLVLQLERYMRMRRFIEYGIITLEDIMVNNYLQKTSGPLLQPCSQAGSV